MVRYYPNKEWTDACAIHARTDPVRFADERKLQRDILIAVETYQNITSLEKKLKIDKKSKIKKGLQTIRSPILDGPPYMFSEPPSTYIHGEIKNEGTVCLGTLVDLF